MKKIKMQEREANRQQAEFAKSLGISQAHISKIEKNIEVPSKQLLTFIAYRYNVNIDWLENKSNESSKKKENTDMKEKEIAAIVIVYNDGSINKQKGMVSVKPSESITCEDLQEQHKELAEIIGIENLIALANHFGGTQIYIPQVEQLVKNVKYKAIIEEFNGENIRQLAKKYDVSTSTVYRLVRGRIVRSSVRQIEGQMDFSDFGI